MNRLKATCWLSLTLLAALIPTQLLAAEPTFKGQKLFRDAQNNIYYFHSGPRAGVSMSVPDVTRTVLGRTDACGVMTLRSQTPPRFVRADGRVVYFDETDPDYPLVAGGEAEVTVSADLKTWTCNTTTGELVYREIPAAPKRPTTQILDKNKIVRVGSIYYLLFPNRKSSSMAVEFVSSGRRSMGINLCGVGKVASNGLFPIPNDAQIQLFQTARPAPNTPAVTTELTPKLRVDSLPVATLPPVCINYAAQTGASTPDPRLFVPLIWQF